MEWRHTWSFGKLKKAIVVGAQKIWKEWGSATRGVGHAAGGWVYSGLHSERDCHPFSSGVVGGMT